MLTTILNFPSRSDAVLISYAHTWSISYIVYPLPVISICPLSLRFVTLCAVPILSIFSCEEFEIISLVANTVYPPISGSSGSSGFGVGGGSGSPSALKVYSYTTFPSVIFAVWSSVNT